MTDFQSQLAIRLGLFVTIVTAANIYAAIGGN